MLILVGEKGGGGGVRQIILNWFVVSRERRSWKESTVARQNLFIDPLLPSSLEFFYLLA